MKPQNHYEIRYVLKSANDCDIEKAIRVISDEKRDEIRSKIDKYGYRFVSCKKLYPFNCMKNQHNFQLIYNICYNRMSDMECGEVPYDNDEYLRLEETRDKAGEFMSMGCDPCTWVPYDTWKEMKELSESAIIHRQNACIENGRLDLVTYC